MSLGGAASVTMASGSSADSIAVGGIGQTSEDKLYSVFCGNSYHGIICSGTAMNGYRYLIERNRLMCQLEDELGKLNNLGVADRQAETARLQAQFDIRLKQLYAQVAGEYPGERKIKARPIEDPR